MPENQKTGELKIKYKKLKKKKKSLVIEKECTKNSLVKSWHQVPSQKENGNQLLGM